LLEAYFDEFSSKIDKNDNKDNLSEDESNNISLFIRARLDEEKEEFNTFIDTYLNHTGKTEDDLPQLVFIEDMYPYTKMPSLFNAADCFVLPSHGEGWGLPLIEAMAIGLPTIGTNFSGNTEFMTPENSYLVKVKGMVDAPTSGHKWAEPDSEDLREIIRRVYTNRVEAKEKGSRARQDIKEFSLQKVGDIVIQKLTDLQARIPELIVQRAGKKMRIDEARRQRGSNQNTQQSSSNRWQSTYKKPDLLEGYVRMKIMEDL